jgi:hypothetical protein
MLFLHSLPNHPINLDTRASVGAQQEISLEIMTPNQRVWFRQLVVLSPPSSTPVRRVQLFLPISLALLTNHQNPSPNHPISEQHSRRKIYQRIGQNRVPRWLARSSPVGIPSQLRRSEERQRGRRDGGRRRSRGGAVDGQREGDSPGAPLQRLHRRQLHHQEERPPPCRRQLRRPRRSPPQNPSRICIYRRLW